MTKIIGNSTSRDRVNSLLDKSFPSYRQAYSDRKAWLMACLSELAYIRFNPLFPNSKPERVVSWQHINAVGQQSCGRQQGCRP